MDWNFYCTLPALHDGKGNEQKTGRIKVKKGEITAWKIP